VATVAAKADAGAVKDFLREGYPRLTDADAAALLEAPDKIGSISSDGFCLIGRNPNERHFGVVYLYPRGTEKELLAPVLAKALVESQAQYPDDVGWPIHAAFTDLPNGGPKDEPDAQTNYNLCAAWAGIFPDAILFQDEQGWWYVGGRWTGKTVEGTTLAAAANTAVSLLGA